MDNLSYASERARQHQLTVVIEPLNPYDNPGYFLNSLDQALDIVNELDLDNVKVMFDFYHMQIIHGNVLRRAEANMPMIGHMQLAAVPDRGEPGQGELDCVGVCRGLDAMGWTGYVGAEYRPRGTTDEGLGWMSAVSRG